jgi:hypothetical protein
MYTNLREMCGQTRNKEEAFVKLDEAVEVSDRRIHQYLRAGTTRNLIAGMFGRSLLRSSRHAVKHVWPDTMTSVTVTNCMIS